METFPLVVECMTWQDTCELDQAIHYSQFSDILNFVFWGAEQHLKAKRMALLEVDDRQELLDMSSREYLPPYA